MTFKPGQSGNPSGRPKRPAISSRVSSLKDSLLIAIKRVNEAAATPHSMIGVVSIGSEEESASTPDKSDYVSALKTQGLEQAESTHATDCESEQTHATDSGPEGTQCSE
jgi:hypothetical protein